MTTMLTTGDQFPDIVLTNGRAILLPAADLESQYTVVLFYRAHWYLAAGR